MSPEEDVFDLTPPEDHLGPKQWKAVLLFAASGIRTESYRGAGYTGSRHDAARFFRRPKIRRAIEAIMARAIASGDEALRRLTLHMRADIRQAFPHDKWLAGLPDAVALTIKSITPTKHGVRVEFYDAQRAAQLLAQAGGKLKETIKVENTLEEILARANAHDSETVPKELGPGADE